MHTFDYKETPKQLLTADIVNMLSSLHEFKGRQELYIEAESDVLTALLDITKIQSTKASNKIEGIYTSDERLEALVMDKVEPRNRSEEEIAGYREVLATVHTVMSIFLSVRIIFCNYIATSTVSTATTLGVDSRIRIML